MAERMTRGEEPFATVRSGCNPYAPPADTGEALGLPASAADPDDRLRADRSSSRTARTASASPTSGPAALADLPKFPNETMDPARCGGDICVQACANDPQVAVHAIRNLARVGVRHRRGAVFAAGLRPHLVDHPRPGHAAKPVRVQGRNQQHQGRGHRHARQARLGADGDGPDWLTGGTYLVTRRIRMRIENWDRTTLLEQERVIGRQKGSGAPNGLTRRVRRPRLRPRGRQGQAADRRRRPRPAGLAGAPRRHRDPAPRLQLHRRLRRFRPPRRRAVLHRVRAQPRDAVHPDADANCPAATRSTSTSPTPAPRCSHARRGCARATRPPTGVRRCSAARPVRRVRGTAVLGDRLGDSAARTPRVVRSTGSSSSAVELVRYLGRPGRPPLLLGDRTGRRVELLRTSARPAATACSAARTSSMNSRTAVRKRVLGIDIRRHVDRRDASGIRSAGSPAAGTRSITFCANANAGCPVGTSSIDELRDLPSQGLALLPLRELLVQRDRFAGEHCGHPVAELAHQRIGDVVDGERVLRRVLGDARVKQHLQQHVSEFLAQLVGVAAAHRVEQLVGLLQQVAAQRVVCLLALPRA